MRKYQEINNEGQKRDNKSGASVQENYRKTTEVVKRMKEEHIVRRMLYVDIPGKRRRVRPNLRWKDACKRDMAEVGLKRTTRQTGQHGGIPSSAIPATPDDGTSQGRRRSNKEGGQTYDGKMHVGETWRMRDKKGWPNEQDEMEDDGGRVRREKKGLTFSFTNIGLDYYSTTLSCTYWSWIYLTSCVKSDPLDFKCPVWYT